MDKSDFALFASHDLKQWEKLSDITIPGTSECPEFFELGIEGAPGEKRWIFYGGNGRYLIGRFDGRRFETESGPHTLHFGNCFYASQTYSDIPPEDGRRILVGWGQINLPNMPFNQMMTFPVVLTLRQTESGPRLFTFPIKEIESLRSTTYSWSPRQLEAGDDPLYRVQGELFDIEAEFAPDGAAELGLTIRGVPVTYNIQKQELSCLDKRAPLALKEGKLRLRMLVDRVSIEIFANDGEVYMPMGFIPNEHDKSITLFVRGGEANLSLLNVHELRSIWP
jgi:fructan beta-fructosidase